MERLAKWPSVEFSDSFYGDLEFLIKNNKSTTTHLLLQVANGKHERFKSSNPKRRDIFFLETIVCVFFTLEGVVSIELWKILDVLFVNKWSLNWICFKLDGWENQAPSGS